MEDYKKMIRKKVEEEPREFIKNLEESVKRRFNVLRGEVNPKQAERVGMPVPMIGPDVEARPGFKADQERLFKKSEEAYAEAGMPMERDKMSPMERAALLEEIAREQAIKANKGPRGL